MGKVKTITATTTESAVEFSATYQFMWFRNFGESDCYICTHSGIVANADDVTLLKAGEATRLTLPQAPAQNKAYIKAASDSNTVEVHAQNFSDVPFAWNEAGEGGGSDITIVALSATENKTYTAPTGTAYSPVTVNVPTATLGTKTITQDGTYNASTDNLDGYSSVTVDTAYHLPDGYTQLDYVETPSSGQAGFEITGYTSTDYDIHETKTMPYSFGAEAGFAGCDNGGALELYYTSSGDLKVYSLDSGIDLIGSRSATLNNAYITKAMTKSTYKSGFKIGYYKLQNYPFYGRMYYYNVYRPTRDVEDITLLYNFIPCKRNSDNKVGFYETVNDTFYSSTTGTDFVAPSE